MKNYPFNVDLSLILFIGVAANAQRTYILQADRVFDGEQIHSGW